MTKKADVGENKTMIKILFRGGEFYGSWCT